MPVRARIGPYTLVATVADGGMARVFLAHHQETGEICVLKQLHQELEEHVTAALRFRREAAIASRLDHPHIARVLDAGFHQGRFYIALEFVAGQTLEELMKEALVPPGVAIGMMSAVLDGLSCAHQARGESGEKLNIVHRDITPRNIMVSYDGDVKIIDFGIARAQIDGFRTSPGVVIGTLGYMAPEQALTLALDGRSDLYSAGVILYELLTRQLVQPAADLKEKLRQIVQTSPPPIRTVKPELPESLEAVVMKAVSKLPADRFQSAAAFREALLAAWPSPATREEIGELVRARFSRRERETQWLIGGVSSDPEALASLDKTIEHQIEELASMEWSFAETSPGLASHAASSADDEMVLKTPPPTALQDPRLLGEALRSLPPDGEMMVALLTVPLDEVMLRLHESRFTGALELGDLTNPERVLFRNGAIAGTSRAPALDAQLLTKRLLELGLVEPTTLEAFPLGLKHPDADLLARYLVERGLIDRLQLLRARTEQAVHRLFAMFNLREGIARIREGMGQLVDFVPRFVDIRPVIAHGIVIRSDKRRRLAAAIRFSEKRVRMIAPYDEARNHFWLPPRVMSALRALADGLELGTTPVLPKLDEMTSIGVLLLLERLSLLEVSSSPLQRETVGF